MNVVGATLTLVVLCAWICVADDADVLAPAMRAPPIAICGDSGEPCQSALDDVAVQDSTNGDAAAAAAILAALPPPSQGRMDYIDAIAALYGERNLTDAVRLLEKSAIEGGEARAYWLLAALHAYGIGVAYSEAKAVLYHTMAAMGGVPESHAALAYRFHHGIGVAADCEKASFHAKAVADAVAASYNEGILPKPRTMKLSQTPYPRTNKRKSGFGLVALLAGGTQSSLGGRASGARQQNQVSESEMVQYHTFKAEKGQEQSQLFLANAHLFGTHGVRQHAGRAKEYLDTAAAKGLSAAYGALGQLLLLGVPHSDTPVPADKKAALEAFRKGASLGDPVSLNGLGYLYANGVDGVLDRDMTQAVSYFERASVSGNAEALYNLGVMHLHGKGGVQQDVSKAVSLLMRAHVAGAALAAWQLGNLHKRGVPNIVPQNCPLSLSFFDYVIEKGSWSRLLHTAYDAYADGDYFVSFFDYLQAAETGSAAARWNAAYLLEEELVTVTQNNGALREIQIFRPAASDEPSWLAPEASATSLTLALMERTAAEGDMDAHLSVGDAYYYGIGAEADVERARDHYVHAASAGNAQARFNLGLHFQFDSRVNSVDDIAQERASSARPVFDDGGDLHLAKRYYDQALESNPQSFIAVRLALMSLNFHWWLRHFGSDGGDSIHLDKLTESVQLGIFNWLSSWVPGSGITGSLSSRGTKSSSSAPWQVLGYAWDDALLCVCAISLVLMLVLRNYIVHR